MMKKRKYPSQHDAQLIIDIINAPTIHTGYCSEEFRKMGGKFNTPPKEFYKLQKKAFGPDSPWAIKTSTRGRRPISKLYWDKDKAKQLGLS